MEVSRRGEIAFALAVYKADRQGLDDLLRGLDDLEKLSKKTGIPDKELWSFAEEVIREVVNRRYKK